jgi:hypothetical protein
LSSEVFVFGAGIEDDAARAGGENFGNQGRGADGTEVEGDGVDRTGDIGLLESLVRVRFTTLRSAP